MKTTELQRVQEHNRYVLAAANGRLLIRKEIKRWRKLRKKYGWLLIDEPKN